MNSGSWNLSEKGTSKEQSLRNSDFSAKNATNNINHSIYAFKIRVVKDGEQIGVMSKQDALTYAKGFGLDLIEITKQDNVSICIVADYGKFKYEQCLKEKQKRKSQVSVSEKELLFSPNIEQHDLDVQINKLREFLAKGFHVQLKVRAKKRKIQPHKDRWFEIINSVIAAVSDVSEVTSKPAFSERSIIAKLSPKKAITPSPKSLTSENKVPNGG